MAKPVSYTWPAPATAAICALQTTTGAGSLIINGTLATQLPANNTVTFPGISRAVTITSAGNVSAVTFTVTGTYRNQTVTYTHIGPNATTINSTQLFDTITSVTANAAVTIATSVGTYSVGQTHWFKYNPHASDCSLSAQVSVTSTIAYSFLSTLDDVQTNSAPTTFKSIANMSSQTTSQIGAHATLQLPFTGVGAPTYLTPVYLKLPINYCCISIESSGAAGALSATIIQQGID